MVLVFKRLFLLSLTLVFLHTQAQAETEVTLQEAVERALVRSDQVIAGMKRVESAGHRYAEAWGHLLPKVTLHERYMKTDTPAYVFSTKINQEAFTLEDLGGAPDSFNDPDTVEDYETVLSLEQVLFSRRAFLGTEMAGAEREAARLRFSREEQEVVFRVYEAYFNSLMAEAYLETAESALQDAEEHLRLAKVAVAAGTGLEADRLRAEVALSDARRLKLKVLNDVELSRLRLGLAMGEDDAIRPLRTSLSGERPELSSLEAALPERPDIRAMEEQVLNARRNVRMMESEFLPDIGFFGALQANDPDTVFGNQGTSYRVGIGLQWNVFSGFTSAARRASARADEEAASRMLAAMKKQARFRVHEAYRRAEEAEKSLDLSNSALLAAEEGARLTRLRYENGLTTMVSLLDAQAALNRARSDLVRTEMEYNLALGRARHEAGTLLLELAGPLGAGRL